MSATSDFYLAQADKCTADAAGSALEQVRDRNLRAAAAWRGMAERVIRTEAARAEKDRAADEARRARTGEGPAIG